MSKDIEKLRQVNLGVLDTFELERFRKKIQQELDYRKDNPDDLVTLYHLDDGCEGLYCPIGQFNNIDPQKFFEFVCMTLKNENPFTVKIVEMAQRDAKEVLDRYGWFKNNDYEKL